MEDAEYDVIVVGAGMAGLAAARDLRAADKCVLVLEARDRVGGRLLNHTWRDGSVGELGGQWLGPTHRRAYRVAREAGVDAFPTHEDGFHQVAFRGKLKAFKGETYGLPPFVLLDVALTQLRLERMAKQVPLAKPWAARRADDWDRQTFETWLRANMRTDLGRDFFRGVCTGVLCAEAWEMSLLHFLFYVHSGELLNSLLGLKGGAQEARLVGGSQRLATGLAEPLGDVIQLSAPVRAIAQSDDCVTVHHDRGSATAARAIVALPPALAGRIDYSPALPAARAQLTQRVPMGSVIKCMARYPRPFWRAKGHSGFTISVEHDINIVLDNSPHDASCGVLVAFFEGNAARKASALTQAERERVVLEHFAFTIGPEALNAIEYADKDWSADPWSGGCYGGHLGAGVWTAYGPALRTPCGRIHWSGTETSDTWNGYIEGALASGERAASEVLRIL